MADGPQRAQGLVERIKQLHPTLPVAFVHASGRDLPARIAVLPGVTQPRAAHARDYGDPLVVATIDKLADAYLRDGLANFDVLVMDEAYQADAGRYYTEAAGRPSPSCLRLIAPLT
jgi:hypothetical protein